METSFTDSLHSICRAMLEALSESVPGEILACDLVQIDRREFRFQSVAAAHFTGSPVRRLLLGCEERLACYLAETLLAGPDTEKGDAVHDGLQRFCRHLQHKLAAHGLGEAGERMFLVHDHEQFRVQCSGVRNFLFRVAVAEGRLDLIIDLAPRVLECDWLVSELDRGRITRVETDSCAITNPDLVKRIMAHLAGSDADVQVKLAGDDDRLELLQATFLSTHHDPDREVLPLTCARRTSLERAEDIPEKVTLVFILQDKLLQCTCPVVHHDHAWLDDDISLPILELGLPASVTYGQRRGAFRLVPPERIDGGVRRVLRGDNLVASVSRKVPVTLADISFTGAMLRLGNEALISGFKGGTEVEITLRLPEGYGEVELLGIVRRLHLDPAESRRGTTLGVEFLPDTCATALATVRRYIQHCHSCDLSHGSARLRIG